MLIVIIFSLDQRLYFSGRGIELQPLLVDGLRYAVLCDAGDVQPFFDGLNGVFVWSKHCMDQLWAVVLAIAL